MMILSTESKDKISYWNFDIPSILAATLNSNVWAKERLGHWVPNYPLFFSPVPLCFPSLCRLILTFGLPTIWHHIKIQYSSSLPSAFENCYPSYLDSFHYKWSFQMYLLINVKRISVARFNFSLNFPCFCEPESPPSPIIWQCTLSLFIFYCADRSSEAGNSTREMECLFNNFFLLHWNWSMTFYLFRVNKHKLKTYLLKTKQFSE